MEKIIKKHDRIKQIILEINAISASATSKKVIFFNNISIHVGYNTSEGCFKDLINWLYAMYIEVSSPSFKFFTDKFKPYSISISEEVLNTDKLIHSLRTVSSHNLDFTKKEDQNKKNYCESWFSRLISKNNPEQESEWLTCVNAILDNVTTNLEALKKCLETVIKEEHFDIVLEEWLRRIDRNYSPYEFELVFLQALKQFNIENFLDSTKITKQEYSKWKEELKVLKDGFDFKTEAFKIVTKYIIKEDYCPVEPKDLIDMGAPKNQKLKDLMKEVKAQFHKNPCSKEELLQWVKETSLIE